LGEGEIGYRLEGPSCFVYQFPALGYVPLLRYFNQKTGNHFYTVNTNELAHGFDGYVFESIASYVIFR
jgi:hypothetical protein